MNNFLFINSKIVSKRQYAICLSLGMIPLALAIIILFYRVELHDVLPPCAMYTNYGWYCFGCGGTRSVIALLHLKILDSFRLHVFVPYTAVCYLAYLISWSLNIISRGKIRALKFSPIIVYIGATIIVIQCIIKNIILYVNGSCI